MEHKLFQNIVSPPANVFGGEHKGPSRPVRAGHNQHLHVIALDRVLTGFKLRFSGGEVEWDVRRYSVRRLRVNRYRGQHEKQAKNSQGFQSCVFHTISFWSRMS